MLSTATPRPIHFFTALRDPAKQIASHYNWLIEIFHRSREFYDGHPPRVKEISERIRATDNASAAAVIAQIEDAPGLFLNQQSRMVLGENLGDMSADMLRDRLSVFNFIAIEATLPNLLHHLLGEAMGRLTRENSSGYHFDPAVFQSPAMQEFLKDRHAADIKLYEFVNQTNSLG